MAWSKGNGSVLIDQRRRLIATIMVRRPTATVREIQAKLGEKFLNPNTNKPFTHGTVHNDIRKVRAGWREQSQRDYDEWITDRIGELEEVREAAWQNDDLELVLKTHDRIVKLLGLDAPTKLDVSWREEAKREGIDPDELFNDLVEQFTAAMVGAGSGGSVGDS